MYATFLFYFISGGAFSLEYADRNLIRYREVYSDQQEIFQELFARIHCKLNELFAHMNEQFKNDSRYFHAQDSRDLIWMIENLEDLESFLRNSQYAINLDLIYKKHLEHCKPFLKSTYGSQIPENYQRINLKKYESILDLKLSSFTKKSEEKIVPKLIGEGAFSKVFKIKDESFGTLYALKRLNKKVTQRDKERFDQEYKIMNKLSSPYVLSVYKFFSERKEYVMEYCDSTLLDYVQKNNSKLSFYQRKRIVEQILYGLMYIHSKNLFHRDLSYKNILIKKYDKGVVSVKLSDFGLVKSEEFTYTKTDSTLKGTIRDPSLESLKEYKLENEIYVIGYLINYVFTGKQNLSNLDDDKNISREIVKRCTTSNKSERYASLDIILQDIQDLSK